MPDAWRHYRAFGLGLRSRLALPELAPTRRHDADVEIDLGPVPETLEGAASRGVRYEAAPGRLLLKVDGIARYLVSDGRRVRVDRLEDAEDDAVRLFLFGSAIGALLHQRNDLVLHGSAIAVGGAGVGFLGASGIGKSTLAVALNRRGYPLVSDDLCVLRDGTGGPPRIMPGIPRSKLWLDSLRRLEIPAEGLARVRRELEKRELPVEAFMGKPVPVRKLYLLATSNRDELRLQPLQGPRKFTALKNHTYRFQFLNGLGAREPHFRQGLALAQRTPVCLVTRPREPFRLEELADRIEADLRA